MAINAEVLRVRDVFSSAADIRVPPFQRGFAWGDEETEALIKDLLEAFRNSVIYFLGAIVVIRPKGRGPSDVVDGQQRLTTLTIILAVMRDLSRSADEQAMLHANIGHEALMFVGAQRWRITLNTSDTPFLRQNIQMRGATADPEKARQAARDSKSESQARLAAAVRLIHDELTDMADEERSRFAQWLLDEVSVVRVRVSEYAIGHKVFESLNHRGKPLSDHDILKSALFERAGFTPDEAVEQSARWNAFTNRLSDKGFGDMLKQVRALYDRQGTGELVDGLLQSIMQRMSFSTFLNEKLPRFVDAYDAIVKANTNHIDPGADALRSLCHLRSIQHESWRAPAMLFLVEHPYDQDGAARFFKALDRLAYMMQYAVKDREYRHRRYRRVLDAMDRGDDLFESPSPLELSVQERSDFLERLRGRFPNFKQRRALLMRFNAAVPGGASIDPRADATVEHILPKAPTKGSDWYDEWSRARDRDELTECIGNFTLLTHAENQEADVAPFTQKIDIYFRNGDPSYALSNDLRGRTRWTPDDVRARREQLVNYIAAEWQL